MDRTKHEILTSMAAEMPYNIPLQASPYLQEAMEIYAEQEAKSFTSWLAYEKRDKRTIHDLWKDYKKQFATHV